MEEMRFIQKPRYRNTPHRDAVTKQTKENVELYLLAAVMITNLMMESWHQRCYLHVHVHIQTMNN